VTNSRDGEEKPSPLSRRSALGLLGSFGAGAAAIPLLSAAPAVAETGFNAPAFLKTPDTGGASPVQGLHLTFGADPSTQMIVSWITDGAVKNPRVMYGTLEHGFGSGADATTRTYVDGTSGRTVYVHHAQLNRLKPGTEYVYMVSHDGAPPDSAIFKTAPRGRVPLTFTSFGDQAAPQVSWSADGTPVLDNNSTPASKDIVAGIEQVAPLFHLLNGDLCYANRDVDRVRTWNNFFTNNTVRPASAPGCPRPATTRSSPATARSGWAPSRRTSPCHRPRPTPNSPACGTRSPLARSGSSCCRTTTTFTSTRVTCTSPATPVAGSSPSSSGN
jgi:hypothetical protein